MTQPLPGGFQAGILAAAIRYRGIVIAVACLLIGYGVYSLSTSVRYDVFPEFAPPQVAIQTEAPGLSPEQVEQLVTRTVESAVQGVAGVDKLRSTSIQGLSVVTVFFTPGADVYRDRQLVAERLTSTAQVLPTGVLPPQMTPLTSSTSTVVVLGLTSAMRSQMELRTVADWNLRMRLLAVPGVADVAVFGGDRRSIQIQVHPDRLVRFDIAMADVLAAAKRATGVRGAGFLDTPAQRIVVQTEGQTVTAAAVGRTVLRTSGAASITLADVADVVEAPEPAIGGALVEGRPGVILVVAEQYGANTKLVAASVQAALTALRPSLQADGVELHADLFEPAKFIATAVGNVGESLLIGGALVVAVLFVFLGNVRTAIISVTAIPLSLLTAIVVLDRLGISLNTMTLGGLAIAIGEVVDDAVIDVENIIRRLRENALLPAPRPEARVVLDASFEVRGAVVYATLAVVLVFVPVITLGGISGRLFGPLGLAYMLAIVASLVVALTVTPALAMALLAGRDVGHSDSRAARWLRARYVNVLDGLLPKAGLAIGIAAALTIAGAAALPFFGGSFIPELREGHFVVHVSAVPGTSIAESLRIGGVVNATLKRLPFVRSVAQRVGRAERSTDTWGTHYSEIEVDLKPLDGEASEFAQADIRKALAGIVGVNSSVKSFLTERVEETLSGYTAAVAVNIYGSNLDALDRSASAVAETLRAVRGATEVQVQSPPGLPQVTVTLRPADLQRWGLDGTDVLDTVRTAFQGDAAGQVYDGAQTFNLVTVLAPDSRRDPAAIGALPLRTPSGRFVTLAEIADVKPGSGRYQVLHDGGRRLQSVTANVADGDVGGFVARAKVALAKVPLPPGGYIEFAGAAEEQARGQNDLLVNALIAAVGVILLLSVVTRNARNLVLVLVNLPFALVGGVIAVFASGGLLTLGSMVGFVTLFGITLRNSIMMISHYEHLVEVEGQAWGPAAALKGASDRLVPIMMTSLVTALGLLPLVLAFGTPGREVQGPMAVVILGGLLTSMALNLMLLPILALRFGRFEPARDIFAAPVQPGRLA